MEKNKVDNSETHDLKDELYEYLYKNKNESYTVDELCKNLKLHEENKILLHMDLTRLIWEDKIEYRDIYNQEHKFVRFYSIK